MKGFIKITDTNQKDHYLNTHYIIKFTPIYGDSIGATRIYVFENQEDTLRKITTTTTPEEVLDMINLAN